MTAALARLCAEASLFAYVCAHQSHPADAECWGSYCQFPRAAS